MKIKPVLGLDLFKPGLDIVQSGEPPAAFSRSLPRTELCSGSGGGLPGSEISTTFSVMVFKENRLKFYYRACPVVKAKLSTTGVF
jgi:hypothetical protein